MRISDLITKEIIRMLNESEGQIAEIQRNGAGGADRRGGCQCQMGVRADHPRGALLCGT